MKFDPNTQHRRSIRLKGYDYTQAGAYFITICSQNRECLFGEIAEGEMHLSAAGNLIQTVWNQIPAYYPGIDIAEFVVMPNHIHGIIIIVGAGPRACPAYARGLICSIQSMQPSLSDRGIIIACQITQNIAAKREKTGENLLTPRHNR